MVKPFPGLKLFDRHPSVLRPSVCGLVVSNGLG
jgi:hypothetical protein